MLEALQRHRTPLAASEEVFFHDKDFEQTFVCVEERIVAGNKLYEGITSTRQSPECELDQDLKISPGPLIRGATLVSSPSSSVRTNGPFASGIGR